MRCVPGDLELLARANNVILPKNRCESPAYDHAVIYPTAEAAAAAAEAIAAIVGRRRQGVHRCGRATVEHWHIMPPRRSPRLMR